MPDFIDENEEQALIEHVQGLPYAPVRMHGIDSRRRVTHFGLRYTYEGRGVEPGEPVPPWLLGLRERCAHLIDKAPAELAEILVTEYTAGSVIGWHRDAPMFGRVVGVSLGAAARMRFQRGRGAERQVFEQPLAPRSAYVLRGAARWQWQHSIPAVKALRYSITFRTLRVA